jgi:hypothetical protein
MQVALFFGLICRESGDWLIFGLHGLAIALVEPCIKDFGAFRRFYKPHTAVGHADEKAVVAQSNQTFAGVLRVELEIVGTAPFDRPRVADFDGHDSVRRAVHNIAKLAGRFA